MWANVHKTYLTTEGEEEAGDTDAEKGPWRITLDGPSYIADLSHVSDNDIREKIYKAYLTRASDIGDDSNSNVPLVYEILKLKEEMSHILGFNNYAEMSLTSKMAPSVASVKELSELFLEKALPAPEAELAAVTALARSEGGDEYSEENMEKLSPWDITFWSGRLKESKFELTEEELRPYFSLPLVLGGMFSLVERIFNIKVEAADKDVETWNTDVQFFKVFDVDSEKHIASLYLDPYSRPADKRGGA